jgi:nucleoside 2-deoxyribosyltransferase
MEMQAQRRTIYVAGATGSPEEVERCEKMMARLRAAGVEVVSDWPETIKRASGPNPMDIPREQRAMYANTDLNQVSQAQAFWILLPEETPTIGAWVELGFALALAYVAQFALAQGLLERQRWVLCSGKERSIFTACADYYATDEEAFAMITAKPEQLTNEIPER